MDFTRLGFIQGALASLGFGTLFGGRLFAAPPGWKHGGKPNLVFGVLADTHFRTDGEWRRGLKSDKFFVAALKYFRSQDVDAVVHCGDMADRGLVEEMRLHADAWRKVFPKNRAANGRVVEKLFVTGNHDIDSWRKGLDFSMFVPNRDEWPEKIINQDIAGHWERIWGEKYEPVWHKTVKGYSFFGKNWGVPEIELKNLVDAKNEPCGLSEGSRPFFFITHDWIHGECIPSIGCHPNAFGLWGHWHFSAANWNIVRMLNGTTPGVQCPACPSWWRPDGKYMGGGDKCVSKVSIEGKLQGGQWEQGLVVRVYDDMLVIERREFGEGGSLGADWVMPLGKRDPHPFSKDELKKVIGEPQFRKGARIVFEKASASPLLRVRIPLADGNHDSRVYAYEVEVSGEDAGKKLLKAVYAAGCNMGIGHEPNKGVTTLEIPKSELPPGKVLTIAVRPLSSLGTSGKPIVAVLKA